MPLAQQHAMEVMYNELSVCISDYISEANCLLISSQTQYNHPSTIVVIVIRTFLAINRVVHNLFPPSPVCITRM